MTTIERFFDQAIVIQRMKATSGNKRTHQATATSDGHIQSLDERARQALGVLDQKAWKAWFPVELDVREGDRLVDGHSRTYTVQEVVEKDYAFGINQHIECILVEWNE